MLVEADLKEFYNILEGLNPLTDPENDERYVHRLQHNPSGDPISRLRKHIEWSNSNSVSLITGFRGNGKTTELHRLEKQLQADPGSHVIFLDMDHYVHDAEPLDITELLLALLAALSEELSTHHQLETLSQNYWEKLRDFLSQDVEFEDLKLKTALPGAGVELGIKLSQETHLKRRIKERLASHVSTLYRQINEFVSEAVDALREKANNPDLKIIILVDSLEHIRGDITAFETVYHSIIDTFTTQGERLHFLKAHMVYTVPPILALYANAASLINSGKLLTMWPNIHVRKGSDRDPEGLALMRNIINQRFSRWSEIIPEPLLNDIAWYSGGDLREYFRLLRELLVRADTSQTNIPKFEAQQIKAVVADVRNQLRMLLTQDIKQRMAEIHQQKRLNPSSNADYEPLMRLLDTNLIMNYRNGEDWFDIHPLLIDEITSTTNTTE